MKERRLVPREATTQLEHCGANRTTPFGINFITVRMLSLTVLVGEGKG